MPLAAAADTPNAGNTGSNIASDNNDLKLGMTGEKVSELQKWLKEGNFYTGNVDGNYNVYTEQAVKLFQKTVNIKEDGWVGTETQQAMKQWNNGTLRAKTSVKAQNNSTSDTANNKSYKKSSSTSKTTTGKTYKTSNQKSYKSTGYSNRNYSYKYSGSKGTGDCWDNSNYLYGQLTSSGQKVRIIQYGTSWSSNHRSVQTYQNGGWVDYDYSGYATRYHATKNKPGMAVIK